jgi:carbon-monoxide dehydrogenase medium subunit
LLSIDKLKLLSTKISVTVTNSLSVVLLQGGIMKPAPFRYEKPALLEEVFAMLESHGDDARILAGGQSLLATLNMRLSAPEFLVDISALDSLRGIAVEAGLLRIGALTTQTEIMGSADVARYVPLLAQTVPFIAHSAIRNRGTLGGSLAHADPAAELPACMLALDATMEIAGTAGTRSVGASDFFHGLYETDLKPGEVLISVTIPIIADGYRSGFSEFSRRSGDFAMAGLAAHAKFDHATVSDVRLAFCGVDIRAVRATAAEQTLEGKPFSAELLVQAKACLAEDLDPPDDLQASGKMKIHLSQVLLERVFSAMSRAGDA